MSDAHSAGRDAARDAARVSDEVARIAELAEREEREEDARRAGRRESAAPSLSRMSAARDSGADENASTDEQANDVAATTRVALSIVVPLYGDAASRANIGQLVRELADQAAALVASYEVLVVADAANRDAAAALTTKPGALHSAAEGEAEDEAEGDAGASAATRSSGSGTARAIAIYALRDGAGESAALRAAFRLARGAYIVTMPPLPLVAGDSLARVLARLRAGESVVLAHRAGANAAPLLHRFLARATGLPLSDLGCGVRGLARVVAKELADAGDLARFLPFLAHRNGHAVSEVAVDASPEARRWRGASVRSLYDGLAVLFLLRFARAPLRLFGTTGALVVLAGLVISATVAADKILNGTPLARRPILVLGALLIVIGVQTISLGILGEITVFARARRHREYRVDRVLR
ncbi:MAG: hypothetical protein ACKVU1_13560 [bacterium]